MTHHDPDPTPAHGIARPDAIESARQAQMDRWTWPDRGTATWTDVARLVARLDSAAIAAGHPATYGKLKLITPDAIGAPARIERIGSPDRIPGGSALPSDPAAARDTLAARLAVYTDLADAAHDVATLYHFPRTTK